MIIIDGSVGGGQVLRTSLSLSVLTGKSFKIIDIRGKRENKGLKNQHLTAVKSAAEICNAETKWAEINSDKIEFIPNKIIPGNYKFDIGTAGSTVLVLQTLLPPLIFTEEKSVLEIKGGTANPFAPPALEIKEVFLWHLDNMGININLQLIKEGFYPRGGGKIKVEINPCNKTKEIYFSESKNKIGEIQIMSVSSSRLNDKNVSRRMIEGFIEASPKGHKINSNEIYVETLSPGCFIHANYKDDKHKFGMSILGEKFRKAEDVGKECADELLKELRSGASVDKFTADQLLIYMAVKGEGSIKVSEITDHIKTNINTIEKFLDVNFKIENNLISCRKK